MSLRLHNKLYNSIKRKKKLKNMSSCSICLELMESSPTTAAENTTRTLSECGHKFHIDCINHWLINRTSCPLCRTLIGRPDDNLPVARQLFRLESVEYTVIPAVEDDGPEFTVDRVLDRRLNRSRNNRVEYLILWMGYINPTWEPLANCINCMELIVEYEETVRERTYINL